MDIVPKINSRMMDNMTKTDTGLAVGTDVAISAIIGNKLDGQPLGVNIITILRNLIENLAYTNNKKPEYMLGSGNTQTIFMEEIKKLASVLEGKTNYYLYYIDRTSLYYRYNNGKCKVIPKKYTKLIPYMKVISSYAKHINTDFNITNYITKNSLLLTSVTADLIDNNVILLESHTGAIKSRSSFGSRLHPVGSSGIDNLPLNKYTLYTFGDKNFIVPYPEVKIKKLILEVCGKSGVNYMTSGADLLNILSKEEGLQEYLSKHLRRL